MDGLDLNLITELNYRIKNEESFTLMDAIQLLKGKNTINSRVEFTGNENMTTQLKEASSIISTLISEKNSLE